MPKPSHAARSVLALLAACAADPTGGEVRRPAVATGNLAVGVQVWNQLPEPLRCRVTAHGHRGEMVELVAGLVVPPIRHPIDPSLGGDPSAQAVVHGSLPAGRWTLHVDDGRGRRASLTIVPSMTTWAIAFVGPDGIHIVGDSGPRRLE